MASNWQAQHNSQTSKSLVDKCQFTNINYYQWYMLLLLYELSKAFDLLLQYAALYCSVEILL